MQKKLYKISRTHCKLTYVCVSQKKGIERKLTFRENNKIFDTGPTCLLKNLSKTFLLVK